MEDNFDQNEFEEFLKDQVRNHKMYPSDAVWRDINKKLHGDKKWPALTFAAIALTLATISICAYFFPKPNIFAIAPSAAAINSVQPIAKNDNKTSGATSPGSLYEDKLKSPLLFNKNIEVENTADIITGNKIAVRENNDEKNRNSYFKQNNGEKTLTSDFADGFNHASAEKERKIYDLVTSKNSIQTEQNQFAGQIAEKPVTNKIPKTSTATVNQPTVKDYNDKNMVDGFLKDNKEDLALYTVKKPKSNKNKFSYQLYVAPSVSYRKLLEDPTILSTTTNSAPVGLNNVTDVNKVVRHKPGNGFEAGFSVLYNLSEKFRIKTGFQFNVRQYNIEAYRSGSEVASIALVQNNRVETVVNTVAIYRNNNGLYSTELKNRYYQLAVPVGVEWEVVGNRKIQLNVAGTIQPTYLINRNAYLLSTNFKNYSKNPSMVRAWNINSNIEAFLSFKVGDFKWQIGPQLRYQPYSTFIPQYPIKEHLLDYGIKVGVSKSF